MFYRVFILFSTIFLLTLSSAMAEEDLFLGEIKNPSKKSDMSGWGLILEGSFSDSALDVPSNPNGTYEQKVLEFRVALSKLLGHFEPLLSFGYINTEVTELSDKLKSQGFSISTGLIFNITSHKNSVVPFINGGFGYYHITAEEASSETVFQGFAWSAGGGIKFFPTKKRNVAILVRAYYEDTIGGKLEETGSDLGEIDASTSGISSGLGFILYL